MIESTGISEPVPVAQTFSYIDEALSGQKLDTMVTVVDANRFINDINSEDLLVDRDQGEIKQMSAQLLIYLLIKWNSVMF